MRACFWPMAILGEHDDDVLVVILAWFGGANIIPTTIKEHQFIFTQKIKNATFGLQKGLGERGKMRNCKHPHMYIFWSA